MLVKIKTREGRLGLQWDADHCSSDEDQGDVKYKKKNNKRVNWGQVSHKD